MKATISSFSAMPYGRKDISETAPASFAWRARLLELIVKTLQATAVLQRPEGVREGRGERQDRHGERWS